MKLGSRRVVLAAFGATVVSLVGVALATGDQKTSPRSARASLGQSDAQPPGGAVLPACGVEAFPGARQAGGQPGQETRPLRSEEVFENVQVLTGIPVDEFMGTMGVFSAALSFCCSQCHVGAGFSGADWAADTPLKQTARRMVLMMDGINRANFGGRQVVTCWTCHRGSQRPMVTPTMAALYGEPSVEADILQPVPGARSVDEILDKYIQALGGAERLAGLTSFAAEGTSVGFMGPGSVEIFAQAPDRRATIIHSDFGDLAATYDGRAGWKTSLNTPVPVLALTGDELDGARLDAQMSFPGPVKQLFGDWRVSYPITIDDRLAQVIQGGAAGEGLFATFHFDDETGLLTRLVRYAETAVGRVPTQIDYADYREVAGVMMPFRWTLTWLGGQDEYVLNEVRANVPIDPARFARPAAPTQ